MGETVAPAAAAAAAATAATAAASYTLADVAARNGKNDAPVWIIYKDSVYDVTKYIPEHPAGDIITEHAGKDVTRDFDDSHSPDAFVLLKKFKIGEIIEEEKKYDANGKKKKKKKVVAVPPDGKYQSRSCINVVTCGLLG